MLSVVADGQARAELTLDLDELVREGARRMLAAALPSHRSRRASAVVAVAATRTSRTGARTASATAAAASPSRRGSRVR